MNTQEAIDYCVKNVEVIKEKYAFGSIVAKTITSAYELYRTFPEQCAAGVLQTSIEEFNTKYREEIK